MDEYETIRAQGEVIPPGESPEPASVGLGDDEASGPTAASLRTALVVAVAADLLQLLLFPLFAEGMLSPLNDVLDIAVGIYMVKTLGWHWAFLPSFVGELVPVFDELPCWTLAVLLVRAEQAKLRTA